MTTQEVADALVMHCRNNNYKAAYDLYAEDAKSIEMEGMPGPKVTEGKDAIIEGYREWENSIEKEHGGSIEDPVVMGNHFCVPMMADVTFKDRGRSKIEELCMYEVQDGKIKTAQFFYDMSGD